MKTVLKVIKYVLYVLGVLAIGGFLTFFVWGIYRSCVENDIITQQDRIRSAYLFINMLIFGGISVICLLSTLFIKEEIVFDNLLARLKRK